MVIEQQPSRWFYVLEDRGAPNGAWDWRDYATAYGPFPTQAAALKHLHDHHSNPGGYSVVTHDRFRSDEVIERLLREAPARTREINRVSIGGRFGLPPGCVIDFGRM
jgi:hypothetical protein